jgi:hypothetical protein
LPSPDLLVRVAQVYKFPKESLLLLAGYCPWVLSVEEATALIESAAKF